MKMKEDSRTLRAFRVFDRIAGGIIENLGGILVAMVWLIVLWCVICRYLLHRSTGGLDEFNNYFLSLMIWTGAVTTSRKFENGHINIDFISPYIRSGKAKALIKCMWQLIAIATMVIFGSSTYSYMRYLMKRGSTMNGLDFPIWVFIAVMLVCVILLAIYETLFLLNLFFGKFLGWMPYYPFGFITKKTEETKKPKKDEAKSTDKEKEVR